MEKEKKLYKDKKNEKLCGVCAGIAKYFSIDVTLVRLAWALVALGTLGTALLAYIICAIIIPDDPINVIDAGE